MSGQRAVRRVERMAASRREREHRERELPLADGEGERSSLWDHLDELSANSMGRALDQIEQLEVQVRRGLTDKTKREADMFAAERQRRLAAVRFAVNNALVQSFGADGATPLACTGREARDACVAVEAALEHELLPPIFSLSLSPPGLWHALSQLPRRWSGAPRPDDATRQLPLEAVVLARTLCEKHLAESAPSSPSSVRDAYAARLWLCLALQRRVRRRSLLPHQCKLTDDGGHFFPQQVLSEWVLVLARALHGSYVGGRSCRVARRGPLITAGTFA